MQKLFRVRVEADSSLPNPPLSFVDDDPENESSLGVRVWSRDAALIATLESVFDEFVQQYRDAGTVVSPGACLESLVHGLDAALGGMPERIEELELAVALACGRGLYLLHTANLEARCAQGGAAQPLRSTLEVRVKDLSPATMRRSPAWRPELVENLRLIRVFVQDETRATLSLVAGRTAAETTPVLVVEKDVAPEVEPVELGASGWPDFDDAPRRDRRTLSYAAIGLVTVLFATAIFGMWRWQRIGSHAAASPADGLFAGTLDASLEGRSSAAHVAPENIDEPAGDRDAGRERDAVESDPGHALQIVWSKRHRDWVTSSPRLARGHVVYGCRDGHLYAVDADGEVQWDYDSGAGIGATPAVDGDRVFCGNYSGRVFAVAAKNGRETWGAELGARIVASPVVGRKHVFVATQAGDVVALEKKNGKEAWRHAVGGKLRVTPLVADDRVLVPTADGDLLCLKLKSGEVGWTYHAGTAVTSSPLRVGDRIVFGTKDGGVHAVEMRDGSLAWMQRTKGAVQAAPALGGDLVYVASGDRRLYALRAATGEVAWSFPTQANLLATPGVADGRVYLAAYDRHTYVLDARSGRQISKLRLKAPIYSSPLVVEDRIYVGSNDGTLYCMSASR